MKPKRGWIIVDVDFDQHAKIKLGSLELFQDTTFNEHLHAADHAEVSVLPEGYTGDLQVGDIVVGSHLTFDKENILAKEGNKSLVVVKDEPYNIFCYIRDGVIRVCANKLLCKEIELGDKYPSFLINPFKKVSDKKALVTHVPKGEEDIKVGDTVYYTNQAAYKLKVMGEEFVCIHDYERQALAVTREELAA